MSTAFPTQPASAWKKPNRIFRFFPPEDSAIFRERKLWYSNVAYFNDIFEVCPAFDPTEHIERTLRKEYRRSAQFLGETFQQFRTRMDPIARELEERGRHETPQDFQNKFGQKYGVLCFCENLQSALMWAHYTTSHKGFAMEFDLSDGVFSPTHFAQVLYSDKRLDLVGGSSDGVRLILTKSVEWEYEAEWRMVKELSQLTKGIFKGRERYFEPLLPGMIKAVYLGLKAGPETREELLKGLTGDLGHVKAYLMRRHTSEFKLEELELQIARKGGPSESRPHGTP